MIEVPLLFEIVKARAHVYCIVCVYAAEIQCDNVKVLGTDRVSGMFDGD